MFRLEMCRSDLVVKKLRYYARFIVVCLLLKKMKLVRELVKVFMIHNFIFLNIQVYFLNVLFLKT